MFDESNMPFFVDVAWYEKIENKELKKHINISFISPSESPIP